MVRYHSGSNTLIPIEQRGCVIKGHTCAIIVVYVMWAGLGFSHFSKPLYSEKRAVKMIFTESFWLETTPLSMVLKEKHYTLPECGPL